MLSTNTGTAKLFIGVVIGLILLKAVVAWLTGSISILAQAADSFLDLFAGITTYSAVRIATKPPDAEHPYGHGKAEDIAGAVQGVLIFVAGGLIIYSSIQRIIEGATIQLTEAGIGVMLVSIVVSLFLSRHLLKVSRSTSSVALEASARNIAADVYSASAVLVGLLVVRFTGLSYVDSIIAIGVATYVLKIAYETTFKSLSGLVDTRLDASQEASIKVVLEEHGRQMVGFHKLRTRRAGNQRYVDLHLVVAKDISVEQAHEICDHLETEIQGRLPRASVIIHIEPCRDECQGCFVVCSRRRGEELP